MRPALRFFPSRKVSHCARKNIPDVGNLPSAAPRSADPARIEGSCNATQAGYAGALHGLDDRHDAFGEPFCLVQGDVATFPTEKAGNRIISALAVDGTNWKFSVVDNGVGRPDGVFAQAKTGLGTGIVKALAQQLDAVVETIATPDGTTVTITHATFQNSEAGEENPVIPAHRLVPAA